jgi:DNA-binding NarL/FixJ family response regulator
MKSISLALIDDYPIIIEGLTRVFGSQEAFKVVATGGSSRDALAIAEKYQPDLVIMDVPPFESTTATIAEIKARHPSVRILVFTADLGVEHAVSALEAGAQGYVSKSCSMDELWHAAKTVMSGETYVSRSFASRVLTALRAASTRKITVQSLKLSAREDQIVHRLLGGKTNREISSDLGITERTVKHYMSILMQKLNARNRVEVVIAAQNLNCSTFGRFGSEAACFGSDDQPEITGKRSYHS